jgi:vacuolar-type H+-ATPase subunit F/Vma7
MEIKETKEERIKLEPGNTYFFICFALVCGGKSTFFEQIISQTNSDQNKDKYNISIVSSDKIREDLSHQMQKENPNMTFKQCFDKVGKETAKKFDKEIKKAIDNKKQDKINIILVDKNYPQGIDKFLKFFCKDKESQFFLVFIPRIKKPININGLEFPFSLDYFFQCYLRLKNRHGHEVLNGEDENSKMVYLSFFKLFQNFDFYNKIYSNAEYENNVFLQEIDFTDETKEIEVDNDFVQFFNNVIRRLKAFDMENIKQNHESEINKFFGIIEEKYDGKNFFSDTRELIKNQVQDLLENGFYNLLN